MSMTPERWQETHDYIAEVHGAQDEFMARLSARAIEAGLPDISVGPEMGRLLMILTSLSGAGQGAEVVVEVGTLAGYSALWMARGLAPSGRLITCEPNDTHADFAERAIRDAGESGRIEVRREPGLEALPRLLSELGEASVDVVFLDAVKREYPDYLPHARRLVKPGGLLLADNALGVRSYWITDPPGENPDRDALDRFNREVAAAEELESVAVPLRQGLLIARRMG